MTGASGIFTPLPGAFLYSQYHFWNAEAKSGWSRGYHLLIQVVALAEVLKSIPVTPYPQLLDAARKMAFLATLVRAATAYVLELNSRKIKISRENFDRLTIFCNIFDKCSHRVFQICFIAATSLTLYKERERAVVSLAIGLVSIVADRLWFGKTPISLLNVDSRTQRLQEFCRLLFAASSLLHIGTNLLLLEDGVIFTEKKIIEEVKRKVHKVEAEMEKQREQRRLQMRHELFEIALFMFETQETLLNVHAQQLEALYSVATPYGSSSGAKRPLTEHYVAGVESLLKFLDTPTAIAADQEILANLKDNLVEAGFLLFGSFAVIEEALEFDPSSAPSHPERRELIEPLHNKLKTLNKKNQLDELKLFIVTGNNPTDDLTALRNALVQVSGVYTGVYPGDGPPNNGEHRAIFAGAKTKITALLAPPATRDEGTT